MKKILVALLVTFCLTLTPITVMAADFSESVQNDWNLAAQIIQTVQRPSIPAKDYVITQYGAVDNGKNDVRPAIMKAIEAASKNGGGRVVLPSGTWYSKGPIHLKSNIELHVVEGATLLFSPNPQDYLPVVLTKWEGTEVYNYSPMIYACNVHDVAITGKGVIDGNTNSVFHSWTKLQKNDQIALRKMGATGVPTKDRVFGAGHFLRPCMIQFFEANKVLLQDYTVKNSPFWVNHLNYTNNAIVNHITVDSHRSNNDGVDIESSTNVLVQNNIFRTGDDSVVVKSGRDYDGRRVGRASENIVVFQNDMGGEDGMALGSEMSGGIRNVFFTDNILRKGGSAFRFKSNLDRGGTVENIRVRNMKIDSFERLFWFQLKYPGELGGYYPAIYRNIVFENLTVENADTVFEAHAPQGYPLQDVLIRNVEIKKAKTPLILDSVENIRFENVIINGQRVDATFDWK
jgi:polygalacturonase